MPEQLIPDFEAFVASLTDEQATFLHVHLQGVMGQRVMPLREAALNRVLDSEDKVGQTEKMYRRFFRPVEPIVAVRIGGPQPVRKRGKR